MTTGTPVAPALPDDSGLADMADAGQPDIRRRGIMLVLSSPSGAGKTSIGRAVLARDKRLAISISVTTRPKRPTEQDGVDYFFTDPAGFEAMAAAGDLLEHARVFGHRYGTPRRPVDARLADGYDVLFDIDWQGTQQLAETARADLVNIFILPPTADELGRRLRGRAEDSETVIRRRLAQAADDVTHWQEYAYVLVNRSFATSVAKVEAILLAERLRRQRQVGLADFVNGLRQPLRDLVGD